MVDNLFDTENETALLSIILANPGKVYELQNVKSFMFGSEVNKNLFMSIESMLQQNLVPDLTLLTNYLGTIGKLESIGSTGYLNYLKSQTYAPENLIQYENLIVDTFKAKTIISAAAEVPGMIKGSGIDIVLKHIRNIIDSLTLNSGGETTVSLFDALRIGWDTIVAKIENPGISGFTTGFSKVDQVIGGVDPSDLWILAARPSIGKTALVCNSMINAARKGSGTLLISYEMTKQQVIERLLAIETGIPILDIHLGMIDAKKLESIKEAAGRLKDLQVYIDAFPGDINYVTNTIRKYHKNQGISLVYIDYVQLMAERSSEQTHELGRISRELKLLAKDLGIGIILVSQLSRGVEAMPDKRPLLSHLRQSGNLEEDADKVVMLYRDSYYNPETKYPKSLEYIIRKNRQGPIGAIELNIELETNKIE